MTDNRKMRDVYWMLGIGFLSLALVAGFVRYRQPTEFMNAINTGHSVRARQLLDSGVDPTKLPDQADLLICAVLYCDPATLRRCKPSSIRESMLIARLRRLSMNLRRSIMQSFIVAVIWLMFCCETEPMLGPK